MKKIKVKVIPRAKANKILRQKEGLKVYLTASPVAGKANRSLVKILADFFRVKKSNIRIIKGEKSREKIIEIENT